MSLRSGTHHDQEHVSCAIRDLSRWSFMTCHVALKRANAMIGRIFSSLRLHHGLSAALALFLTLMGSFTGTLDMH